MRNSRQGDSARRGRRSSGRPGAPGGSPYDFSDDREDNVDPVDLLAIRADDELLDALASGRPPAGNFAAADSGLDMAIHDDRQMLALLQALREDVDSEPFPELLSVDEASEAIVAGTRAARPRRRLMPVAAAAAVAVFAMSGVAIGASNAQPGDPLWGVSTMLNGNRAKSVEAAQRVSIALSSAQQALAEGRTADAKAALASVQGELDKVQDPEKKDELARKTANLAETAEAAPEGEKVETDERGSRKDSDSDKDRDKHRDKDKGQNPAASEPGRPGDPRDTKPSNPGNPPFDPRTLIAPGQPGSEQPKPDPRGQQPGGPGNGGQPSQQPQPQPSQQPQKPPPSQQPQKPPPQHSAKPEPKPAPQTTKPANEKPPETTKPAHENPKQPPENKPKPKPNSGGSTEGHHDRPDKSDNSGKEKDKGTSNGGGEAEGQPDPRPAGQTPSAQDPTTIQGVGVLPADPVV